MSSTYKFKVGDIVEHIGGRGNTGKVTRVAADKITVVFEDCSKDYNYNIDTRSLRLVKGKTVETEYNYPIYKKHKHSQLVIKFTDLLEGHVEVGVKGMYELGDYVSNLTPHYNETVWKDYTTEPIAKHICEVLEEKVNLETAIRFAKNYTEWASSKDYSDSIKNASSLINSFNWLKSKEGHSFWCKIEDRVLLIKATASYSTFTKYEKMALPEEVKETEKQLSSTKKQKTKPIQTKTESTIMTKLKTTATSVATQNKDAIKVAAKLEAGKIINKQVIKQVKPHLPLLVRGLADHPAASIVLANVVSIAVKHFMPENKKLNTVAELMLGAAAVDTVASFNIEAFVEDLLKNIKLPTGALDDDN